MNAVSNAPGIDDMIQEGASRAIPTVKNEPDEIPYDSFREFIPDVFEEINPGDTFVDNWHIGAMAHHLEAVRNDELQRLLIMAPPRASKSTVVSVAWPAWILGHDPTRHILCCSHGSGLVKQLSTDCRQVVRSSWYQEAFGGNASISEEQDTKKRWALEAGGQRTSVSVGSGSSGEGGHYLVADDPLDAAEAESRAVRKSTRQWLEKSFFTRTNDTLERKAPMVMAMHRVHEQDPANMAIERDWEVLELKAQATTTTTFPVQKPDGSEDTREQEEGESIDEQRWSSSDMDDKRKSVGDADFETQYMHNPTDAEGGLFNRADWKFVDRPPRDPDVSVRPWDLAGTEGDRDPNFSRTSGLRMSAIDKGEEEGIDFYIEDLEVGQWSPGTRDEHIKETSRMDPQRVLYIIEQEGGSGGKSQIQTIRNKLLNRRVIARSPSGDKTTRADPVASQAEGGHIYIVRGSWNREFLSEVKSFPGGTWDDIVDSLSGGYDYIVEELRGDQENQSKGKAIGGLGF